eukprot:m.70549 g.70549  ORF g.70549 m.70549 type:complete len:91 (-) comp10020_c0_seq1:393-665(-)
MTAMRAQVRRLAESWPVVAERGKRDFGAYVQGALSKRLDRLIRAGTPESATKAFVQAEVEALAQLRKGEFKARYGHCALTPSWQRLTETT